MTWVDVGRTPSLETVQATTDRTDKAHGPWPPNATLLSPIEQIHNRGSERINGSSTDVGDLVVHKPQPGTAQNGGWSHSPA